MTFLKPIRSLLNAKVLQGFGSTCTEEAQKFWTSTVFVYFETEAGVIEYQSLTSSDLQCACVQTVLVLERGPRGSRGLI